MSDSLKSAEDWFKNNDKYKKKHKRGVASMVEDFEMKLAADKRIREAELKKRVDAVTTEQRKKFINTWNAGGISLKDAYTAAGIDSLDVAIELVKEQTKTYSYLANVKD